MSNMVKTGSKYTDKERIEAAVLWAYHGSFSHVSRELCIPRTTLIGWSKHELWDDAVVRARQEIGDKILAQNMKIATKAGERVLDSLENGDEKLIWDKDKSEHVIKLVKPSGKDAAVIGGISQDKARVQLNLPTSITDNRDSKKWLADLADQFSQLSREYEIRGLKSIDGECEAVE